MHCKSRKKNNTTGKIWRFFWVFSYTFYDHGPKTVV